MKKFQYLLVLLLPIFIAAQHKIDDTITYKNPIIDANLADPYILFENGTYYLFATGEAKDGKQIPIYSSTNLTDWTFEKGFGHLKSINLKTPIICITRHLLNYLQKTQVIKLVLPVQKTFWDHTQTMVLLFHMALLMAIRF